MPPFSSRSRVYLALPLVMTLAGCAGAPAEQLPTLPSVDKDLQARAELLKEQPSLSEAPVPVQWWTLFNDPTLTALESHAAQNLDLQTATARIAESRAQLGLSNAALKPNLSLDGSVARSALSENSPLYLLGAPSTPSNTWKLGLESSWEIDLWGYRRQKADAAGARLEAAYFGREATRVSVAAEIARTYLLLRGTQAQTDITRSNLAIAENMLRLTESRERNGVASRHDSAATQADLDGIKAQLIALERQRADQANALALLLARPPHDLDDLSHSTGLPPMPTTLPMGISSTLAHRRPDILQAEAQLHAALSDIGAARADFYPRLSLGASAGVEGFEFSDLGSWASRNFSLGPTLHLPIFEGGRLKGQLKLSEARHQLAAVNYQRTVLNAWHEVDQALNAYTSEETRHQHLENAVTQNKIALQAAQDGYREGNQDVLAVLTARRSLLASQSALADSATASALSVVSLYRALGGGWSPELLANSSGAQRS